MPFKSSFIEQKWTLASIWIHFLWISTLVDAGTVRVDDADSAISYSGSWQNGNGCSSCWAHPDAGQANGGTWHDAGYSTSADRAFEFTFKGTDIGVYGIVNNGRITDAQTQTNVPELIAYIDGASLGSHTQGVSGSDTYNYNVAMVQITRLSDSTHTLRIEVKAYRTLLFDYLEYTTEDVVASESTTGNTSTDTSTSSGLTTSNSQSSSTTSTSGASTGPSASGLPNGSSNNNNNQQSTIGVDASVGNGNPSTSGSTSKGLSTSSIIGISLGAIALILLVLFFALMRRRHNGRLKARSSYTGMLEPSTDGTSTIDPYIIPETSANSIMVNRSPRISSDGRLTTEESSQQHPDGAWLQMIGLGPPPTSSNALLQPPGAPSTLIVPRPTYLDTARGELNIQQQREQRRLQNANNRDQDDVDHSYIRTPPTEGRATGSSIRAMTAPPPYVWSPPVGMPPVMDDGEDAPDYQA
ncbi:hypothetical protein CPB86DRAFT_784921 [Serendipita vermifera]|nr:hypothetical protein CPB86DRAFT_784921 [Serendipita vermifera]